jgi:hypothetical protein
MPASEYMWVSLPCPLQGKGYFNIDFALADLLLTNKRTTILPRLKQNNKIIKANNAAGACNNQ